jgi:DNA repair exonuclease SbcCD ATPase subunit
LSTLTKVLIVLLTIVSIFLCGIVVTYVANAENYRQKYVDLNNSERATREKERNVTEQLNKTIEQADQQKKVLSGEVALLKQEVDSLKADLAEALRQKDDALQRVNNWAAIVMDFSKTTDKQRQLLEDTHAELKTMQADLIKEQREHKETTTALVEKMSIVAQLEEKTKRLLEEKTELQNRADQFLQQFGKAVAAPVPVTPIKEKAQVAAVTTDIALKGLVSEVDLKNSLAQISIGSADGVKAGMRFHVVRGDEFICDILIFDVEPEKAVGVLELMEATQLQPRAGDNISTNL